jgi:hypothetical protein
MLDFFFKLLKVIVFNITIKIIIIKKNLRIYTKYTPFMDEKINLKKKLLFLLQNCDYQTMNLHKNLHKNYVKNVRFRRSSLILTDITEWRVRLYFSLWCPHCWLVHMHKDVILTKVSLTILCVSTLREHALLEP